MEAGEATDPDFSLVPGGHFATAKELLGTVDDFDKELEAILEAAEAEPETVSEPETPNDPFFEQSRLLLVVVLLLLLSLRITFLLDAG